MTKSNVKAVNDMSKDKTRKGLLIGGAVLLALILLFLGIWLLNRPQTIKGSKSITVDVICRDEKKTYTIRTDEEYLRGALEQEALIEGTEGEFGLFVTTVDGIAADDTKQEWWCFTKEGPELSTGVDEIPIADGDQFEITLKVGW